MKRTVNDVMTRTVVVVGEKAPYKEIVRLLEQNLSNKEIAVRLGIEVATVKNHVHNLLEKLHVQRRTDVARRSTRSARAMAGGTPPDPGLLRIQTVTKAITGMSTSLKTKTIGSRIWIPCLVPENALSSIPPHRRPRRRRP